MRRWWKFLACFVVCRAVCGQDSGASSATRPVDYFVDVRPILREHCVSCHGPDDQRDGLRLDRREFAEKGGFSKKPILGGTLETNELYLRVSSHDMTWRMPKGADALPAAQIEILRRWVEEGCTWPDDAPLVKPTKHRRDWQEWIEVAILLPIFQVVDYQDKVLSYPGVRSALVIGFAALLLTWVAERIRRASQVGQAPVIWGQRFSAGNVLKGWVVGILSTVIYVQYQDRLELHRERDRNLKATNELREQLGKATSATLVDRFGKPPRPVRMLHPKSLARTYYRGNCERNAQLYNGGNYCTAMMHVALEAADGTRLKAGDAIDVTSAVLAFELERARSATPALYDEASMKAVFLSDADITEPQTREAARVRTLTSAQAGDRWTCRYPLTSVNDKGVCSAVVYLCRGLSETEMVTGEPHYAMEYDLHIRDGVLLANSDLWMGALFVPGGNIIPPTDTRIPACEWFDWRPLPIIEGQNSQDPVLLGILDHQPEFRAEEAVISALEVENRSAE